MDLLKSFRILDIPVDSDLDAVKQAYRVQARKWHPDLFTDAPAFKAQAEERFKRINAAYARIRSHLLSRMPDDAPSEAPSSSQKPADDILSEKKEAPCTSWLDHLLDVWDTFMGRGADVAPAAESEKPDATRRNFKQILDEMTDDSISASGGDSVSASVSSAAGRQPVFPYRHSGRSAKTGRVESVRPVVPVKPVRRVGGVGGD